MNSEQVRQRLVLAQESMQRELIALGNEFGPEWSLGIYVDHMDVTSVGDASRRTVPTLRLSATLEAP